MSSSIKDNKAMKMSYRVLSLTFLCAPLLGACFQQVDSGAAKGSAPVHTSEVGFGSVPDPGNGTIPDQTETPPMQIVTDVSKEPGDTDIAASACDAINKQVMWLLTSNCGDCHGSQLSVDPTMLTARGGPAWNFVDNPKAMLDPANVTDIKPTATDPGVPFLKKGDPGGSRIYQRMLLGNTSGTPPVQVMPPSTTGRILTVSDFSLINEWIKSCLP